MSRAVIVVTVLLVAACSPAVSGHSPLPVPAATNLVDAAGIRAAGLSHGFGWVYNGNLLVTADQGDHWTRLPLPADLAVAMSTAEVFNAVTAWVAWLEPGQTALLHVSRTRTAGLQWSTTSLTLSRPAHGVYLSFPSDKLGWVTVDEQQTMNSDAGQVFATADGGDTWAERRSVSGRATLLLPSGRGFAVEIPTLKLWTSPDNGAGWALVSGDTGATLPSFADGLHGLYASSSAIYGTSDGGATWTAVSRLAAPERTAAAGGSEWFALSINPIRLWRSADSGRTWSSVSATGLGSAGLDGLWFDGKTGWALSRNVGSCAVGKTQCTVRSVFARTRDGGRTWQPITPSA